ncbi:pentatricopeptide repeat-containing protein [Planoprotostelium fungivorum]|uniref:Pentatricopeptide repeat-containing protein n=1 Tax=Planoprotostelium fungivorum TaxID=1890364 RepID=A0A2P6N1N7_9EUKA|nr:pentatricopeptide repeat-containing protein [Planoprotostelium fungivorum]
MLALRRVLTFPPPPRLISRTIHLKTTRITSNLIPPRIFPTHLSSPRHLHIWTEGDEKKLTRTLVKLAEEGKYNEIIRQIESHSESGILNINHITVAFYACVRQGNTDHTEYLFQTLYSRGLKPDIRLYNEAIRLYVRLNDLKKITDLLQRMRTEKVEMDSYTYNCILPLLARTDAVRFDQMWNSMKSSGLLDIVSFGIRIDMLAKKGDKAGVEDTLRDMAAMNIKPNTYILTNILLMFAHEQKVDKAELVWDKISEPDVFAFNVMLHLYATVGDVEKLEACWKNFQHKKLTPDRKTYHTLVTAYAKKCDRVKTEEMLEKMKERRFYFEPTYVAVAAMYDRMGLADKHAVFAEQWEKDREEHKNQRV